MQLDAFQFKKHGNGTFSNIVIDGYKSQVTPTSVSGGAVQILDKITYDSQVLTGKIKLNNVKISNTDNNFISGVNTITVTAENFSTNWSTGAATGANLTAGSWATINGVNLLSNL